MTLYVPYDGDATAVLVFDRPVGPAGASVTLVSDDPSIASVVSPVSVAAGEIACTFVVTWVSDGDATITASYGGVDRELAVTCLEETGGGTVAVPCMAGAVGVAVASAHAFGGLEIADAHAGAVGVAVAVAVPIQWSELAEVVRFDAPIVQTVEFESTLSLEYPS